MLDLLSNSIIASFLISFAIGIVGTLMLLGRYNYLAAGIAHGSYGGVGLALYFGFSILLGATLFALSLGLLFAYISLKSQRTDILISIIWAVGMSIGIIFSDLTPGYHPDLLAYLFGDILLVPKSDLYFMTGVDLLLLLFVLPLFHHLVTVAYDKEFAKSRGLYVELLHTLLLLLMALTIVMSIRSIGLILVIALFSIPPFIAERFAKSIKEMMVLSMAIGLTIMLSGLMLSYWLNIAATASIVIVGALFFFITLLKGEI